MSGESIYRGTYVIERTTDGETYEVLISVSADVPAITVTEAYDPLLHEVSEKIEKHRALLKVAEEDVEHVEVIPNAPTIRSVEAQKEK